MVVPERELLAALIHKIEDEFRVLAVLARQDVLPLEHGRIEAASAVRCKAILDDSLNVFAAEHLARAIVARALSDRTIAVE